jgi:hypothetical protein
MVEPSEPGIPQPQASIKKLDSRIAEKDLGVPSIHRYILRDPSLQQLRILMSIYEKTSVPESLPGAVVLGSFW